MKTIELILQSHPEENGAAALGMILSCYGKSVPLSELVDKKLDSAARIISAAHTYGLSARGYRMSWEDISKAPLPLLAHWKFRSFVVLTGIRNGRIELLSPEEGRLILSQKEFEAGFTGVAICFAPPQEPAAEKRQDVPDVFRSFPSVGLLLLCAEFFVGICRGAAALLLHVMGEQLTVSSVSLGLWAGGIVLLQMGAQAFQLCLLRRCGRILRTGKVRRLRGELEEKRPGFFQKTSRYRLEVLGTGCGDVPEAAVRRLFYRLQLCGGLFCLFLMAAQDGAATAVAVATAALYGALCWMGREEAYSEEKVVRRDRFCLWDRAMEDAAQRETSLLKGETGKRFRLWLSQSFGAARREAARRQETLWRLFAAVICVLPPLACILHMLHGAVGTGSFFGCVYLSGALASILRVLPGLLREEAILRSAEEEAEQVFPRTEEKREETSVVAGQPRSLTVQNVSLSTGKGNPIEGITFTVRRGELLIVCAGAEERAALTQVVSGQEPPAQGELYLDKTPASALNGRETAKQIALLGGGLPLPGGTIRENIAAGLHDITDYAVAEAASDALLHPSVLLQKGGYDAPASALSRGEQILLEFAGAFARGVSFVVADGLTGRLDAETEARLMAALRRRKVGAVLLTEDRALLRKGDLVCLIENGGMAVVDRAELISGEEGKTVAAQ